MGNAGKELFFLIHGVTMVNLIQECIEREVVSSAVPRFRRTVGTVGLQGGTYEGEGTDLGRSQASAVKGRTTQAAARTKRSPPDPIQ